MSRGYRYESILFPTGTGNATLTVDNGPERFLPGGMTLTVGVIASGSYTILVKSGDPVELAQLYVDPETGLSTFTVPRAFRLPVCRAVSIVLAGVAETVRASLGGPTFTPYK